MGFRNCCPQNPRGCTPPKFWINCRKFKFQFFNLNFLCLIWKSLRSLYAKNQVPTFKISIYKNLQVIPAEPSQNPPKTLKTALNCARLVPWMSSRAETVSFERKRVQNKGRKPPLIFVGRSCPGAEIGGMSSLEGQFKALNGDFSSPETWKLN